MTHEARVGETKARRLRTLQRDVRALGQLDARADDFRIHLRDRLLAQAEAMGHDGQPAPRRTRCRIHPHHTAGTV